MILFRTRFFPINNNTKHFRTREENCRWCKANDIYNVEDELHVIENCKFNRSIFKDKNGLEINIKVEDYFKCNNRERTWELANALKKLYDITEEDWRIFKGTGEVESTKHKMNTNEQTQEDGD